MGNSEGHVVVVNKHSERLKVRVDCNRYVTIFKIDASFKGYEISHQEATKPTYIVDTSDSFAWVGGMDKLNYAIGGGMCYISVADENNAPICINHPIPSGATVTIENNLVYVDEKTKIAASEYAIIIENCSKIEIEARVDTDKGVCSFETSMTAKGAKVTVAGSSEEYYRVDSSQGLTKIASGQKSVFFVRGLNNTAFVTINSEKLPEPLCKNFAVTQKKTHGHALSFNNKISGPMLIVENDSKHVAKFLNKRFYHSEVKAADGIAVMSPLKWEIVDDE